MNVTKYPQSCLLVEHEGVRILIDPGSFVQPQFDVDDFGTLDAVLITHEHADHVDTELLSRIVNGLSIPVIGNASTKQVLGDMMTQVVSDGEGLDIQGLSVIAYELPHVLLPDGSAGPQNTGYLIGNTLFHPGDGVELQDVPARVLAAPIAGPDISPKDVVSFAQAVRAEVVIPIHYDYFPSDPQFFVGLLQNFGIKVVPLANGESVDI